MKNLAYYKVNYIMPIYLEYAPLVISKKSLESKKDKSKKEDTDI